MSRGTYCALLMAFLAGCSSDEPAVWNGWLEADTVAVASSGAGTITQISVVRGQTVKAGEPLYALDATAEQAAVAELQARLTQAESQVADLTKGKRPSELAEVEAQISQAKAARQLSRLQWERQQVLVRDKFVAAERVDEARTVYERDVAQVQRLEAQLASARLEARTDTIESARAQLKAIQAQIEQARWKLSQKTVAAPASGRIEDVLFSAGEWLASGQPALVILPPTALKARFFVAEPQLSMLRIGQSLQLTCDGCKPVSVTVDFIASQPEYTPPVIYSRENRAAQVYRVEARIRPEQTAQLHVGLPIEIAQP